ncbi:MAG: hypothetical protein R2853_03510 [Thermomicrobiales bacterium]
MGVVVGPCAELAVRHHDHLVGAGVVEAGDLLSQETYGQIEQVAPSGRRPSAIRRGVLEFGEVQFLRDHVGQTLDQLGPRQDHVIDFR